MSDFKKLFCGELELLLTELTRDVYKDKGEDLKINLIAIKSTAKDEFRGHFVSPLECVRSRFTPRWLTNQVNNKKVQKAREARFDAWFLEKQKTHFLGNRKGWEEFVSRGRL